VDELFDSEGNEGGGEDEALEELDITGIFDDAA